MIFLHSHKSGIRISLAIVISAAKYRLLLLIFSDVYRKVPGNITQFRFYLFIHIFLAGELFIEFLYGGIYLITGDFAQVGWFRHLVFIAGNLLGILPDLSQLLFHLLFIGLDGSFPDKGVLVRIGFDLGTIRIDL